MGRIPRHDPDLSTAVRRIREYISAAACRRVVRPVVGYPRLYLIGSEATEFMWVELLGTADFLGRLVGCLVAVAATAQPVEDVLEFVDETGEAAGQ
jgi:hypothetical protein